MKYRVRENTKKIPVEARFSASVQTGSGAHPASYTTGTGSLSGVMQPGRGLDNSLPSISLPPPPGFVPSSMVNFTFYLPFVFCLRTRRARHFRYAFVLQTQHSRWSVYRHTDTLVTSADLNATLSVQTRFISALEE